MLIELDADGERIARLERAALQAWPASHERREPDGWVLRSTPGLDRGRCNHALTPCRPLAAAELAPAIARVQTFADAHGTRTGIQVSPDGLHPGLDAELDRRGWTAQAPTLVLVADRARALTQSPVPAPEVEIDDHASPAWCAAWAACEPGRDVEAHRRTVFTRLAGRAWFVRVGVRAVGIGVPDAHEHHLGLFCLAVAPAARRSGLGTGVVAALLAAEDAKQVYLQVESDNDAAQLLYARLGFTEAYRYRHRTAPASPAE